MYQQKEKFEIFFHAKSSVYKLVKKKTTTTTKNHLLLLFAGANFAAACSQTLAD